MTSSKFKFTTMKVVYPPISNREAVWQQADPDVQGLLRQNDLYTIAARAETKLLYMQCDREDDTLDFDSR